MYALTRAQALLEQIYALNVPLAIEDFLVTDRQLANAMDDSPTARDCDEKLLLLEDADGLCMSDRDSLPEETRSEPDERATILLVDDEDSVRTVTRRLLEASGYRVVTASDGREGVEAYQADPTRYDLVLVDRNMPVLDGVAALGEMRRIRGDLRALLMSGASDAMEGIPEDSSPSGFLMKPYGIDELRAAVSTVLAA